MKKFLVFLILVLTISLIGCTKEGATKSSIPPLTPPLSFTSNIQDSTANTHSSTGQTILQPSQSETIKDSTMQNSQTDSNSVAEAPAPSSNTTSSLEEDSKASHSSSSSVEETPETSSVSSLVGSSNVSQSSSSSISSVLPSTSKQTSATTKSSSSMNWELPQTPI